MRFLVVRAIAFPHLTQHMLPQKKLSAHLTPACGMLRRPTQFPARGRDPCKMVGVDEQPLGKLTNQLPAFPKDTL